MGESTTSEGDKSGIKIHAVFSIGTAKLDRVESYCVLHFDKEARSLIELDIYTLNTGHKKSAIKYYGLNKFNLWLYQILFVAVPTTIHT